MEVAAVALAMLAWASTVISTLGAALFVLTPMVGVRLYTIKSHDLRVQVQRRAALTGYPSCVSLEGTGARAVGYAVGRGYVLSSSDDSMWIFATARAYACLTDEPAPAFHTVKPYRSQCKIYEREGSYMYIQLRCRVVHINAEPRAAQLAAIEKIEATLALQGHAVALLHGPTGVGKSMVGPLLAERLGGSFCNSIKPWRPGDTLSALCAEAEPSAARPLIVIFDEADVVLASLHAGEIQAHPKIPTQVCDKEGWNRLFDAVGMGMYPHVVILLTSNRGPEFVRGLDAAYIRPGRVDIVMALT